MEPTKPSHRPRATLQDVAQEAKVSPSTVSIVLAGKAHKRRISEETLQRVQEAATRLGYTPNLLHRSLRQGRTQVISFYNAFRNREWTDLYMDRISSAVEHAGGRFGYDVLVHCNYQRDTNQTYEFLNGGLADGLILFGPGLYDPLLPLLRESGLPTVLIDPRAPETQLSMVEDDEGTGIRLIAEALVQQGHRHLAATVDTLDGVFDPLRRIARMQAELAKLGVTLSDDRVIPWRGSAPEVFDQAMALDPKPTALFVWHDRAAYRLVEVAESHGVSVPTDLSVVGYDGLVWPSTTGHVVTSVLVELDRVGDAAVSLLHRLLEGETAPLTTTIPVSFFPGTTLGPAPR